MSVSAAIRTPETASRIRLQVLTENVLDPLLALLTHVSRTSRGEHEESYLLRPDRSSSLDCLALGYLALFLVPSVPHSFLATTLKQKYPGLTDYVGRGIKQCLGENAKFDGAQAGSSFSNTKDEDDEIDLSTYNNMDIGSGDIELPWREAPPLSTLEDVGIVLRDAIDGVPVLGPLLKPNPIQYSTPTENSTTDPISSNIPMSFLSTILAIGAGVAAIGGAVFYVGGVGLHGAEHSAYEAGSVRRTRLADMGEVGQVLAMGPFGGVNSRETPMGEGVQQNQSAPVVSVAIEPTGEVGS